MDPLNVDRGYIVLTVYDARHRSDGHICQLRNVLDGDLFHTCTPAPFIPAKNYSIGRLPFQENIFLKQIYQF